MTQEEYLVLRKRGEKILMNIVTDLNNCMPYSYNKDSNPNYRTYEAFSEICVALALYEQYISQ